MASPESVCVHYRGQPAPDLFQRVPPPPPSALSQTVASSSSASCDLKLISPLLTNAKVIYHVTRRREFRIAVSLFTPPTLPEEMQMYVCFFFLLWLGEQFKSQGKLFRLEDNKNDLDGNELTQHHPLVLLSLFG